MAVAANDVEAPDRAETDHSRAEFVKPRAVLIRESPPTAFHLALADFKFAHQVLVDAHEREVRFLRCEVARLQGDYPILQDQTVDFSGRETTQQSDDPRGVPFSVKTIPQGLVATAAYTNGAKTQENYAGEVAINSNGGANEGKHSDAVGIDDIVLCRETSSDTIRTAVDVVPTEITDHNHEEVVGERSQTPRTSQRKSSIVATAGRALMRSQIPKDERMIELAMGAFETDRIDQLRQAYRVRNTYSRSSEDLSSDDRKNTSRCKTLLHRILQSPVFELFMGLAVCSNAIFIGWEVHYTTENPEERVPPLPITVIAYCYTIMFVVELALRLAAGCRAFVWDADAKSLMWNYLDIVIVSASIFEVGLDVYTVYQEGSGGADVDLSNLRIVRMVRVFRLIRLLRIARFVRFVRALRTLVYSILCTLRQVFWAIVLLTTIVYVFAILFTQATVSYQTNDRLNPTVPGLETYWASISISMLSLFMAVAGGISWVELINPLVSVNMIWAYLFLMYIVFTYFAVLNVITAVFCQAAMESNSEDQDSMLQTVMRHKKMYTDRFMELFEKLDDDGSGRITLFEFMAHMDDEPMKDYFESLELDCADALCLFDLFDDAEEKGIQVEEFVMGCLRLKGTARSSDMVRLLHENRQVIQALERILGHFKLHTNASKSTLEGFKKGIGIGSTSKRLSNLN